MKQLKENKSKFEEQVSLSNIESDEDSDVDCVMHMMPKGNIGNGQKVNPDSDSLLISSESGTITSSTSSNNTNNNQTYCDYLSTTNTNTSKNHDQNGMFEVHHNGSRKPSTLFDNDGMFIQQSKHFILLDAL